MASATDKEEIQTPEWAKDNDEKTQTTDGASCTAFPFEATTSVEAFEQFLRTKQKELAQDNDYIKNLRDERSMNLLHCACIADCDELIAPLISKYHINVNEADCDGYTPLFYAVNQGSGECVTQLLQFKPRLDVCTSDIVVHATGFPIYICGGRTILHQAAETNSVECAQLILQHMQSFHAPLMMDIVLRPDLNGYSAMQIACMENRAEMLQLLNACIADNCSDDAAILQKLDKECWDADKRKQQKRAYHLAIRERIKQSTETLQKQQQLNIAKYYKPKFAALFFRTDAEFFPMNLLDPTLLQLLDELKQAGDDAVQRMNVVQKYSAPSMGFLQQPLADVVVFRVFSDELCGKLLGESEHYIQQSMQSPHSGLLPITRPNSMNSYGLVLNSIGMTKCWNAFMTNVIAPLADALLPANTHRMARMENDEENEEKQQSCTWQFRSHHSFVIRYKQGEDINLDTHIDASAVTMNICLGKPGFEGAKVYFHAVANSEEDLERNHEHYQSPHAEDGSCQHCRYQLLHKIGCCILHVGHYIHGTTTLTKGDRSNVVIWCKEYAK